jgi:hypothetical protein
VASRSESQPPSVWSKEWSEVTAEDAGAGVSGNVADLLLPIIITLQGNHAIVEKRSPSYIEGAEPGAFWFRNDIVPIRDGEIGFDCIPLKMETVWIEWGPTRGSGLFGRHAERPADAEQRISYEEGREKLQWVRRGTGNVLQECREFFISVDGQLYLLPLHGTGHTVAKRWQTHMTQLKHPNGGVMPAFSHRYHLSTVAQSNSFGHWFNVKFEDRGEVTVPEYLAARELYATVMRGAFRLDNMTDTAALQAPAA